MSDDKVVKLVEYQNQRPEKANPAVPDHIWHRLQDMGSMATEHLGALLSDPRFKHFPIKDQLRIIETTMNRAYGSHDGSVRRNINVNVSPDGVEGFNALRELSQKAHKRLPEFSRPTSREAEVLDPDEEGGAGAISINDPTDTD